MIQPLLPGVFLSLSGALLCVAGVLLLLYEAAALSSRGADGRYRYPPITCYVRDGERAHPHLGVLLAVIVALLLGHFLWH